MAKKITDDIFWIGVNSPDSREFHGIATTRGGSYNSYLIKDNKPTIVEVVNKPFLKEYLDSLKSEIDPSKVQYIILNHAEPDHTGAIAEILKECINATIVCTDKCREFLEIQFGINAKYITVKEGDSLNIGKNELKFFPMPMVHWPESMMTYLVGGVLFSNDLFGTEIAHEKLFSDEIEDFTFLTRDYFAIVMRAFHMQVKKAIDKAKSLEIKYIMPSHGPIHRDKKIMDFYERLCINPEEDKVTIIYYSIWHSTEKMAKDLAKNLQNAELFDISKSNFIQMMASCLTSKVIALGSMTILGGYHPLFEGLFALLKVNNQKGKKVALFGAYGWVSGAVPKMKKKLEELEYKVISEEESRFKPGDIGRLAQRIKKEISS